MLFVLDRISTILAAEWLRLFLFSSRSFFFPFFTFLHDPISLFFCHDSYGVVLDRLDLQQLLSHILLFLLRLILTWGGRFWCLTDGCGNCNLPPSSLKREGGGASLFPLRVPMSVNLFDQYYLFWPCKDCVGITLEADSPCGKCWPSREFGRTRGNRARLIRFSWRGVVGDCIVARPRAMRSSVQSRPSQISNRTIITQSTGSSINRVVTGHVLHPETVSRCPKPSSITIDLSSSIPYTEETAPPTVLTCI